MILRLLRGGAAVAVALLLAAGPALFAGPARAEAAATALPTEQQAALVKTVTEFNEAYRTGDAARVVETIPPRLLQAIAKRAGVDPQALRSGIVAQVRDLLASVKTISFGMDLAGARYLSLPAGAPYVLIPTHTVFEYDGQKVQSQSETLALLDGGQWYLLRITDEAQITALVQVYPEFSSVTFTPGTMKAVP